MTGSANCNTATAREKAEAAGEFKRLANTNRSIRRRHVLRHDHA